jgi:hypothetical protein
LQFGGEVLTELGVRETKNQEPRTREQENKRTKNRKDGLRAVSERGVLWANQDQKLKTQNSKLKTQN